MARVISDGCGKSSSSTTTHTSPSYDEITGGKNRDQSKLPSPAEVLAAHQAWISHEQIRTRNEFFEALPAFRLAVIARIKEGYTTNPGTVLLVQLPDKIKQRTDLLDSEVVAWLKERGWQCTYDTPTIYYNYLRIPTSPNQDDSEKTQA